MDKEQMSPSRSAVIESVLPLKIHFRYCWLFSGVPCYNTESMGNGTEPLTDRELLRVNRTLMTSEEPDLCNQVYEKITYQQETDMKAFWLTTDGRMVFVDRLSEDIKFRYIRERNLRVALSLWATKRELCEQTMRASEVAHNNLIAICGEAARLSEGRFYNLYAKYPLPINSDIAQNVALQALWVHENEIDTKEIWNGEELLIELQPLYTAYFSLITESSTCTKLKDRVSLLGARWLVQEDCSELQFSLNLSRNWFTRMIIWLALFMAMS